MLIEQPAEFNKYVDPTIPLTWAKRWEILRVPLVFMMVAAIFCVEIVAFRLWLNDQSPASDLLRLLVIPACIILGLPCWLELSLRWRHHARRCLKLEQKKVGPKGRMVSWKRFLGWRIEPVPGEVALRKITLQYLSDTKVPQEWSIVLQHPDQVQSLKSELDYLRQIGTATGPLTEFNEPLPPKKRARIRGMVHVALAFYLVVHGAPLLAAGLLPHHKPPESQSDSRFTPKEEEKLRRTVTKYFSSRQQLRRFYVVSGAGLTAGAVTLYVCGLRAARKKEDTTPGKATVGSP